MANYDSREFESLDLAGRFPRRDDILGVDDWIRLIAVIRDLVGQNQTPSWLNQVFETFDKFVQAVRTLRLPGNITRVFVSHQRLDSVWAESIAWHATEVGFEYWLDIHDPTLALANRASLPLPIRAVLIAAVIEMGLLNSTHIVTLQTQQSRGSRWVPYEFGRAKQRTLLTTTAASWFETGVVPDPGGDYLSLAVCALSEPELEAWFDRQPGAIRGLPNTLWPKATPPNRLPN